MPPDHHLWLLIWPGIQSLDLTGPHEVFEAANRVADELGRPGPRYRLRVVAAGGGIIRSESGLGVAADDAESALADLGHPPDTLVLPGGDGVFEAAEDPSVLNAVARLADPSARLATVCTGAFLAAAAGLLVGRRVATHWAHASRLAAAYPETNVDREAIHLHDGAVWSSAGVTAGIDLALAMVEHDHDPKVAQIVGRWLVVHLRRAGTQSQFASPMWAPPACTPPVIEAQKLVQTSPAEDHTVDRLADRVGVSARHLTRLFTAETGETPARFVERVRVDAARHLLENRPDGLTAIATQAGFANPETLRRAFQRRLGLSPDEYRRRFRLSAAG